ncbi:MAG: hypothetical protein AVDCRST_MAG20-2575, partial [uncultured Acidimicrobiales bacterium]
ASGGLPGRHPRAVHVPRRRADRGPACGDQRAPRRVPLVPGGVRVRGRAAGGDLAPLPGDGARGAEGAHRHAPGEGSGHLGL